MIPEPLFGDLIQGCCPGENLTKDDYLGPMFKSFSISALDSHHVIDFDLSILPKGWMYRIPNGYSPHAQCLLNQRKLFSNTSYFVCRVLEADMNEIFSVLLSLGKGLLLYNGPNHSEIHLH